MKIIFTDTFYKSLERFKRHETWWYKIYELFRYNIPAFIRNINSFRKELWKFRSWDYSFNLRLLRRSLELTRDTLQTYGKEVYEYRSQKIQMMNRAIILLSNVSSNNYIQTAEYELGIKLNHDYLFEPDEPQHITDSNNKIFDRAHEIEREQWKELWTIIKGDESLEGSDIRGWWD